MDRTLTTRQVRALAAIVDACDAGSRVTWLVSDDSAATIDGVARHIVLDPQTFAFIGDDDVRDGFLRISGTFEHALPIARVIDLWERGELCFDSDRRWDQR